MKLTIPSDPIYIFYYVVLEYWIFASFPFFMTIPSQFLVVVISLSITFYFIYRIVKDQTNFNIFFAFTFLIAAMGLFSGNLFYFTRTLILDKI